MSVFARKGGRHSWSGPIIVGGAGRQVVREPLVGERGLIVCARCKPGGTDEELDRLCGPRCPVLAARAEERRTGVKRTYRITFMPDGPITEL